MLKTTYSFYVVGLRCGLCVKTTWATFVHVIDVVCCSCMYD